MSTPTQVAASRPAGQWLRSTMSEWATLATTPYQAPDWYRAASRLNDVIPLRAGHGLGAAVLPVWCVRENDHYYHVPREVLCGHREDGFLVGGPIDGDELRRQPWGPALVTTSPYGYQGGPICGAAAGADTLGHLADMMLDVAVRQGVTTVLSHYLFEERDAAWIEALVARGGLPVVAGADCVIDVSWRSLPEYLSALGPGRRSVGRFHAKLRRGDLVWTYQRDPGPAPGQEAAAALFAEHVSRFDPDTPPPTSLLTAIVDGSTMDRVMMSVAEKGGTARSVVAALVGGYALYPKFFGTVQPRADYFALAYARLLEYAISNGFNRIEFGGGTHKAKLLRGARLRYALGVLFVLDPALRSRAEAAARQITAAKLEHFGALAARWQIDHRRPPRPGAVAVLDLPER